MLPGKAVIKSLLMFLSENINIFVFSIFSRYGDVAGSYAKYSSGFHLTSDQKLSVGEPFLKIIGKYVV